MATCSKVNHAGIYIGANQVIEAQPGGAKRSPASHYAHATWSHYPLTPEQRGNIGLAAISLEGTPYGFLDIVALAYAKILGRACPKFIRKWVERSDRLICSQLVDLCYQRAGIQLFADGRPNEDVTPGDLYDLIVEG
jgi:cell wall-associated NlpC family hydrolase